MLHVTSVSHCHHDAQFSIALELLERIGQELVQQMALHTRAYLLYLHILPLLLLKVLPKTINSVSKYALLNVLYLTIHVALITEHCESHIIFKLRIECF